MNISTSELKKELCKRQEELTVCLTDRLHQIFYRIIHEEFLQEDEIHIFDLIVRIVLGADKDPAESIANLMTSLTNDQCFDLEKRTISNSAAFIRDYLKKDYICYALKTKSEGKRDG
ncbi:MAG: hypothetical protein OXB84_06915 [Halobacteriovoraceae bacterium]|nr:hypothetical protein [Halobacteriovoraceae bacterium]